MTAATGELWRAEVHVYGSRKKTTCDLTESVLDQLVHDAREGARPEGRSAPTGAPYPVVRRL